MPQAGMLKRGCGYSDRVRFDMYNNGQVHEGILDRIVPASGGEELPDGEIPFDAVRMCLEPGLYRWKAVKDVELC
jgi:hypothetical protein